LASSCGILICRRGRWPWAKTPYHQVTKHSDGALAWLGMGRRGFAIADADTGQLAGNIAADRTSERTAEVSYWVAPGFRGRGLASSALRGVVAWLAANWQIREVVLWTHAENVASQRAAEQAGCRYQPEIAPAKPADGKLNPRQSLLRRVSIHTGATGCRTRSSPITRRASVLGAGAP
jgi:RimJ/RimL family protein N-acetyltransferase